MVAQGRAAGDSTASSSTSRMTSASRSARSRSARRAGGRRASPPRPPDAARRGTAPRTHRCCRDPRSGSGRGERPSAACACRRTGAAIGSPESSLPRGSMPMPAKCRRCLDPAARHQIHEAEAPRVVVGDGRAVREAEDHMVMGASAPARDGTRPGRGFLSVHRHQEAPGHAEMHDQDLAGGQIRQQIFGPPPERVTSGPAAARRSAGNGKRRSGRAQDHP